MSELIRSQNNKIIIIEIKVKIMTYKSNLRLKEIEIKS